MTHLKKGDIIPADWDICNTLYEIHNSINYFAIVEFRDDGKVAPSDAYLCRERTSAIFFEETGCEAILNPKTEVVEIHVIDPDRLFRWKMRSE